MRITRKYVQHENIYVHSSCVQVSRPTLGFGLTLTFLRLFTSFLLQKFDDNFSTFQLKIKLKMKKIRPTLFFQVMIF